MSKTAACYHRITSYRPIYGHPANAPLSMAAPAMTILSKSPLPMTPLPIDAYLPDVLAFIEARPNNLVLSASPGAGKTTRLPAALLRSQFSQNPHSEIWVLEPRRLAAPRGKLIELLKKTPGPSGSKSDIKCALRARLRKSHQTRFVRKAFLPRRLIFDPELTRHWCRCT